MASVVTVPEPVIDSITVVVPPRLLNFPVKVTGPELKCTPLMVVVDKAPNSYVPVPLVSTTISSSAEEDHLPWFNNTGGGTPPEGKILRVAD